jgi:hypothetical protein
MKKNYGLRKAGSALHTFKRKNDALFLQMDFMSARNGRRQGMLERLAHTMPI